MQLALVKFKHNNVTLQYAALVLMHDHAHVMLMERTTLIVD